MDKILFFHQRNDFTGSTRVLANVIESEFSDRHVTVITISSGEGFLSSLPNVRIIPICFPLSHGEKPIPIVTPLIWRIHALLLAIVYGWRYRIFYINTISPYYAAIVGRIYGKRLIYHIHEKFVVKSLYVKMAEYVFNHVRAKRIFVSKYVRDQYPPKDGCESVVKYNTLPHSFLSAVCAVPVAQRRRDTLILIASLSKAKGIFTYIDVAKKMPEYTFQLMISADMDKIRGFLPHDIPSNVKVISAQRDIHPFLRVSDVVLNLSIPSLWTETFGMTILEAMAYGIPAIVPNVGGPIELVEDGYNGYCIDVTDIGAIMTAIKKILAREDEYSRLCVNSSIKLKSLYKGD